MPTRGSKPRTHEARRAAGQEMPTLPVIVGGRPAPGELDAPPEGLCSCGHGRHASWCAVRAWSEVVPLLVEARLIDRVDRQQLESYCTQVGRARALREAIEWEHDGKGVRTRRRTLEEQFIARTVRGTTSNPLLSQEREAWKEARMLAEGLGLNPVGRTRLTGKQPKRSGLAQLTASLPRPQLAVVGDGE